MSQLSEKTLTAEEFERQKRLRRKNKILALAIGAFALAMIILSYLMFAKYRFIPYE